MDRVRVSACGKEHSRGSSGLEQFQMEKQVSFEQQIVELSVPWDEANHLMGSSPLLLERDLYKSSDMSDTRTHPRFPGPEDSTRESEFCPRVAGRATRRLPTI